MTREHRLARWRALRLGTQMRGTGMRVVVSHDENCGNREHKVCSCDPLTVIYAADGEVFLVGENGTLHRIDRQ